jgi:hypothetical protein
MTFDTTGNVGIGTTTPGSALDVKGSLRLSGATSGYVGFAPASVAGAATYLLPTTQGTAGQVLSTDGVATTPTLSWITPATTNLAGDIGGTIGANTIGAGKVTLIHLSATGTKDASTHLRGDNTWSSFASDVWGTLLTGLSTASNTAITALDSVLVAFGKLQAQVTSLGLTKLDKTGGTLSIGTIDGVPNPVTANQVANKAYVDTAAGSNWVINTASFTASVKGSYFVDTSLGAVTLTLPSSAVLGDRIQVIDVAGTFATNNLIIANNGLKLMGLLENMTVTTNNISFELIYSNATYGWRIK